jgi:predicted Zn-dependent protease
VKDLDHALALEPGEPYCNLNYGRHYLEEGNASKALEYLEKARELDPDTIHLDELLEEARGKLTA